MNQDDEDARNAAEFQADMEKYQKEADILLKAALMRSLTPEEVSVIRFVGRI